MSSRLFSSLLLVISGVSCIKWWPLIQIIIRNVFVKLGPNLHNHHNHHKSDTRDCSRPPRPGNNKINWIQLIQVVVNQVDCKTFWRQDANNNWYEHKSNYWTFKLSFDWHQCSPSKEKNSFYNSTPIAHWGLVILIVLGLGGKDFNWEEEGFVIFTREYLSRGYFILGIDIVVLRKKYL